MAVGKSEDQTPEPEKRQDSAACKPAPRAAVRAQRPGGAGSAVLQGLANLLFMGLIVYLTYYFTVFFAKQPPAPAPIPEAERIAAKKNEEQKADRKLLTTYGPLNPATGAVRIPIERAMDLVASEAARPALSTAGLSAAVAAPAPAPAAETAAAPAGVKPAPAPTTPVAVIPASSTPSPTAVTAMPPVPVAVAVAAPAPAPVAARSGLPPAVLYRAVCMACHDVDGRGGIVRKAMPPIPDFTDPKWQTSRTDAELLHSMFEGKGQLMLPMKDKFALARTEVKEMLAFVRGFQPDRPAGATAAPPAITATPAPGASPAPGAPAALVATASAPALTTSAPGAAAPAAPAASTPSSVTAATPAAPSGPSSTPAPAAASSSSSSSALVLGSGPMESPPGLVAPPPPPRPTPRGMSPEAAAGLRAASGVYQTFCLACHGPDGRGALVRQAMPPIPDFTSKDWHLTKDNALLSVSVLEGKGTLMPAWRGKVTPEQARDLVAYVRSFGPAGLASAEPPPSEFGNRFRELKKRWADLDQEARLISRP
jgi:mono/diheme cytochrome c family protein